MKVELSLTMQGMIRALRLRAQDVVEDVEAARRRDAKGDDAARALLAEEGRRLGRETGHEFSE